MLSSDKLTGFFRGSIGDEAKKVLLHWLWIPMQTTAWTKLSLEKRKKATLLYVVIRSIHRYLIRLDAFGLSVSD